MYSRAQCALLLRLVVIAGGLGLLHPAALAQHGGGGPGGGGPGGGGMGGGRSSMGGMPEGGGFGRDRGNTGNSSESSPNSSGTRSGLQLGPPGRWWDDKHFVKSLQLRPEQQRRMDAAFESNRSVLLKRFEDLQGEQTRMETLVRAKNLDEGALFGEIDRIAQARADLEKATTHYLLQIRGEMDADQIARLEQGQH